MIKFGTGGWRAEIGKDFIEFNIKKVAQSLADRIVDNKENNASVVIGYDRRFLSKEASVWISEVLCSNNIKVLYINRSAPTPLIMHTVLKQDLNYGIEVTASHNPSTYNGIKIIVKEGRDAPVEITQDLEQRCLKANVKCDISFKEGIDKGLITIFKNPFNNFLDDIFSKLDIEAIKQRGLRILFDSMHGSSTYPLNVLFYTTRCTLDQINANKDAYFGGNMPAPTENTLTALIETVKSSNYDIGIGIDGDGDRLGIIDSNGKYISANDILVLLYYYLHEYKGWKGPVVRNYSTTHLLDRMAEDFKEKCYEVPVGFKHISKKIDEVDAVLGGESSGGLTVRGHIHGKDSIYASALFVEMISKTNMSPTELLAKIHAKYGETSFVEYNIELKQGFDINEVSIPNFNKEIEKINKEDGIKVYFKDGSFVTCRPSGTEPLLRIFAEAQDTSIAQSYIEAWKKVI